MYKDLSRLRLGSKGRLIFTKRLAQYLRAGIPLLEALELIKSTSRSKNSTHFMASLIGSVLEGLPLSVGLSRFPRTFDPSYIQLIAVGEASGTLSNSLSLLSVELQERASRIRALLGALAYPFILLFGSLAISLFLIIYVFPKIVPLFRGLHAQLPFTTRTLLFVSAGFSNDWLAIVGCVLFLSFLFAGLLRKPSFRRRLQLLSLRIPFFRGILGTAILTSVFRVIAILLASGARLDEALRIASTGTSNAGYREALGRVRHDVMSGCRFSDSLAKESSYFPVVSVQLVSVGEMTGTLSESVASLAQLYKENLDEELRVLTSLLEPLIMIGMGFVIGFIALAIISPMYGITQSLSV